MLQSSWPQPRARLRRRWNPWKPPFRRSIPLNKVVSCRKSIALLHIVSPHGNNGDRSFGQSSLRQYSAITCGCCWNTSDFPHFGRSGKSFSFDFGLTGFSRSRWFRSSGWRSSWQLLRSLVFLSSFSRYNFPHPLQCQFPFHQPWSPKQKYDPNNQKTKNQRPAEYHWVECQCALLWHFDLGDYDSPRKDPQ